MQEVTVDVAPLDQIEPDVLALAVPEDADAFFSDGRSALDDRLVARLRRLVADGELRGDLGRTVVVHADGETGPRRVAAAGIGNSSGVDEDALRTAAASVARSVR